MEDIIIKALRDSDIKLDAAAILRIVIILVILVAVLIALSVIHKKIKAKYSGPDDLRKLHNFRLAFRLLRIAAIVVGSVTVLQTLGIDLTGMTMLIGLLAIILALALKDAMLDVFVGFMLITDKYFSVGDAVEFDGRDGIVTALNARTTKIEFLDDRSVMSIANRNITKIRKLTHQVDIDLPLSYDLPLSEAAPVLSGICERIGGLDGVERCEFKGAQEFAASAVIYKLRFFCEPHDRPDIRRAALRTIQEDLEAADIHIPYQQIDIHEK